MTTRPEQWMLDQFDRITPEMMRVWALRMFLASSLLWPLTALTLFKGEQQGILGLSFFAVIITAVNILITTDVRKVEDEL